MVTGERMDASKRVRTSWRVRQRYLRARIVFAGLSAVMGLSVMLAVLHGLPSMAPAETVELALSALLPAALAWIVMTLLWRRTRNRNLWDWGAYR